MIAAIVLAACFATYEWPPASGPVAGYAGVVTYEDGREQLFLLKRPAHRVTLRWLDYDVPHQVEVRGLTVDRYLGPASEKSEPVELIFPVAAIADLDLDGDTVIGGGDLFGLFSSPGASAAMANCMKRYHGEQVEH